MPTIDQLTPWITLAGIIISYIVSSRTAKSTVTENLSTMVEQQVAVNKELQAQITALIHEQAKDRLLISEYANGTRLLVVALEMAGIPAPWLPPVEAEK